MRSLYVLEQGATVVRRDGGLAVVVEGVVMERMRAEELGQCVLMGNVGLTTPAVRDLLRSGADVVFLSRGGKFLGRLSSGTSRNVFARIAQHERLREPAAALELARRFVQGKVENQRRLLRRYRKRREDPRLGKSLVELRHLQAAIGGARDLDVLRGLEGRAAVSYFASWPALLDAEGIAFTKRLRRPPPDPVNILLSFGYTLLGNLVQAAVEAAGLDAHRGALHAPHYGRPSLVLDLIEELRPVVVDAAVLRAFNTKAVRATDFEKVEVGDTEAEDAFEREELEHTDGAIPKRGVILTRAGVRKWLAAFERRLEDRAYYPPRGLSLTLRDIARAQVYALSADFEGEARYEPFLSPV